MCVFLFWVLDFLSHSIYWALLASLALCLFLCFSSIASPLLLPLDPLTTRPKHSDPLCDGKTPVRCRVSRHKYVKKRVHQNRDRKVESLATKKTELSHAQWRRAINSKQGTGEVLTKHKTRWYWWEFVSGKRSGCLLECRTCGARPTLTTNVLLNYFTNPCSGTTHTLLTVNIF